MLVVYVPYYQMFCNYLEDIPDLGTQVLVCCYDYHLFDVSWPGECFGINSCLLFRLTSNNEFGHSGSILEYSNLDTLLFSPAVEVGV